MHTTRPEAVVRISASDFAQIYAPNIEFVHEAADAHYSGTLSL
jgi:hypothetical protein